MNKNIFAILYKWYPLIYESFYYKWDSFTPRKYTFGQYHSCRNCNKKIPEDSFTGAIVKCPNCKVAQKKDRCLTRCFVQAVTQLNTTSKVTVTMFHEQIQEVFSLLGRPESLEENDVTLALLDCPLLDIVYDNKSKIVSQVSFHPE